MKLLKVTKNHFEVELSHDDVGILHFALYDYLGKVQSRLRHKDQEEQVIEKQKDLKKRILSMVETINGLI
jgi:hypothetical protein